MPASKVVTTHYGRDKLIDAIVHGLGQTGKSIDDVKSADLSAVDEFHIGGRLATVQFLDQLNIKPDHHVLDIGCGIGGGCRFAAENYGCQVTGVDLTSEYIETGNTICSWVSAQDNIDLQVGDVTALAHQDGTFDAAYMMHVGMNISDKQSLADELYRVLRPGGTLGIYDVMRMNPGDLQFPVPWASDPTGSSVSAPGEYKSALEAAGFTLTAEKSRREFALKFFDDLKKKVASAGGQPSLGLHILMGETAPVKVKNMLENISRNLIAPVELIAKK